MHPAAVLLSLRKTEELTSDQQRALRNLPPKGASSGCTHTTGAPPAGLPHEAAAPPGCAPGLRVAVPALLVHVVPEHDLAAAAPQVRAGAGAPAGHCTHRLVLGGQGPALLGRAMLLLLLLGLQPMGPAVCAICALLDAERAGRLMVRAIRLLLQRVEATTPAHASSRRRRSCQDARAGPAGTVGRK